MTYPTPYSKTLVRLLKSGMVDSGSPEWENLLLHQSEMQDYLRVIGLDLMVKKEDGFAYLRQTELDEGTIGLMPRIPLSYTDSVMLFLLRSLLEEFDHDPIQSAATEKFVSAEELVDEASHLLGEKYNEAKFLKNMDGSIAHMLEWGFLQKAPSAPGRYRIHRMVKEKLSLDDLLEFKRKLQETLGKGNDETQEET
jgi:hypothetical protein